MFRQAKLAMALCVLLALCQPATAGDADRAWRWAPIVYIQDKSANLAAQENVFTTVNFDGDWRANNNWTNLPYYPPPMAAYYSVVESQSHYFLGYYFYHPRHIGGRESEHDMAGLLAAVRKNPVGTETLDAVFTYARNQWRGWDGEDVRLDGGRPAVVIGSGAHGIQVVRASADAMGGTAVCPVLPGAPTDKVSKRNGHGWIHLGYRLVALDELWDRRNDIGKGRVFSRWGYFDSDVPGAGQAAPWVWECRRIKWLAAPAELLQNFRREPAQPVRDLVNPYRQ